MTEGEKIYGLSAYCTGYIFGMDAVKRMHSVWDPALMRRLGPNKSVNGHRILLLYTNFDINCVYPAEPINDTGTYAKKLALKEKVRTSESGAYVERNAGYIFDEADATRYTNYWMMLKDDNG